LIFEHGGAVRRNPLPQAAMIRAVRLEDATRICEIYNHYVRSSPATFEEELLVPEAIQKRIVDASEKYPWLVYEEDGRLLGYGYGRRWRERAAYRNSVETSIYLDPSAIGKGRGSALLGALLGELRARRFHCVIGGVSLPNDASVALLEKFGFQPVAHFKEVGRKFDRWIDVGYWQLLL
jgi:phosphinothricin acetyltransferase